MCIRVQPQAAQLSLDMVSKCPPGWGEAPIKHTCVSIFPIYDIDKVTKDHWNLIFTSINWSVDYVWQSERSFWRLK